MQGWLVGWFAACKVRVEVNLSPNMGTHLLAQYPQSRWAVLLLKLCLQVRSAGPRWFRLEQSSGVAQADWATLSLQPSVAHQGSPWGSHRNRSGLEMLMVCSTWKMRLINPRTQPSKQVWTAFKVCAVNMSSVLHGCRDGAAPDSSSSDTSSLVGWEYPQAW